MSKNIYVKELSKHLNQEIIADFLVLQKELREGKVQYIRLKLADNSGTITANVWNNAQSISEKFKEGDVIRIKGEVRSYKKQLQLSVKKLKALDEVEFDLVDFLESTPKDVNNLSERLFKFIDEISDNYLKKLLQNIFENKVFFTEFAKSPAAKTWHHNYIGGLLEHSIAVAGICEYASHNYNVNRDLLITGALLHDIGKVREYTTKPQIDFSVEGRLVGHIPLGDRIVCEYVAGIDNFPPDLLMKLRHLILSHHGEYEKASARLPQTLEATVLHYADNLDAQTIGIQQLIGSSQKDDAEWTEFDRINNRYYYLK
ncbi:MAG: HD domain-containing protein [Candidatus Cloacimonetes bacterium]|jgi:3'-5' exoribonuclease|nr:HD domain-containing protein [Candidatus Cloacimonadota bacterium]MBT6993587.1 HD domain-containing protein [Candidatus Cloacimonadota bacterium]MBT7470318.1 HD domain-containing protein [Candidatus Cloacimonadota bacterium]